MKTSQALSTRQLTSAAFIVLIGYLASGVLGMVRTAAFNGIFGASAELEAFYAAQRIPEMLFTLVAGGALGSSFIPVFSRFRAQGDINQSWRLASAVMTISALAATVLGILLAITAPLYMPILYNRELYLDLAIGMTRLMLITTVIFSISGLLMGILNTYQNFLLPALALSANNLGLIAGAVLFAPLLSTQIGLFAYPPPDPVAAAHLLPNVTTTAYYLSDKPVNIYGLALGAIIGALLHLTIQLPGLLKINAGLRFLPDFRIQGVMQVLTLMLPRMLGLAVTQINFLVSTAFATGVLMAEGSLTVLNTAWYLMFFALGIIAQSMGTAVFPSLSALAASNEMTGYKERLAGAMRSVLFLSFPATVGLIVLGRPVIAVLFQRGEFTTQATAGAAWALSFYALGIAGFSLLEVLSRAFYALSDTRTPVVVGLVAMISNIILNVVFIQFIGIPGSLERGPFAGLALANALTTLLEGIVLWWILRRRVGGINDLFILNGAFKSLVAAICMGVVVWFVPVVLPTAPDILIVLVGGGVGIVVFFGLSILFRIDEARTIPGIVLRRFQRNS
jgi:putative peptidoglycan lipid II flippase